PARGGRHPSAGRFPPDQRPVPGPAACGRRACRAGLPGPRVASTGRRTPPLHGHLWPGDDPVRVADRPAAVRRAYRAGAARAGTYTGPSPALSPQPRGDATPGGVLSAMFAEEPVAALLPRLRSVDATALPPGRPGGPDGAGRVGAQATAT